MNRLKPFRLWIAAFLLIGLGSLALAQIVIRRPNGQLVIINDDEGRPMRNGVPDWQLKDHMPDDAFTFVRLRYDNYGRGAGWRTDYPDSDLNFSLRLQELTSMEVNPDGKILDIMDEELFDYPWAYMIEPGDIYISDEEAITMRKWMDNGGFLMVDDFWGDYEWEGFDSGFLQKVFPDKKWVEIELDHPIFNCVFTIDKKPQVPALGNAIRYRDQGITWEFQKPNAKDPHYRAMFDDDGRMVCFICFNTDLGDGWEREGEDKWYFETFAEKQAYPLGINVIFYSLTH